MDENVTPGSSYGSSFTAQSVSSNQTDSSGPIKRFFQFLTSASYSRTIGVLAILVILAAVPLTVYISQKQQEIRQHASTDTPDHCAGSDGIRRVAGQPSGLTCTMSSYDSRKDATDCAGAQTENPYYYTTCSSTAATATPTTASGGPAKQPIVYIWNGQYVNPGTVIDADHATAPIDQDIQIGYNRNPDTNAVNLFVDGKDAAHIVKQEMNITTAGAFYITWPKDKFRTAGDHTIYLRGYYCVNNDPTQCNAQTPFTGDHTTQKTITLSGTSVSPTAALSQPAGNVTLSLSLGAPGIGSIGFATNPTNNSLSNQSPKAGALKNVYVCIFPSGATVDPKDPSCANATAKKIMDVPFDAPSGLYKTSTFDMGSIAAGTYQVYVKADKYLRKRVSAPLTVASGTTAYTIAQLILIPGDVNFGDASNWNTINPIDYSALISCWTANPQSSCGSFQNLSDLNDDGLIDQIDLNLFIASLATQVGD